MMYIGNIHQKREQEDTLCPVERAQDLAELGVIVGTSDLQVVCTFESQVSSLPSTSPKRCPGPLNKMISE